MAHVRKIFKNSFGGCYLVALMQSMTLTRGPIYSYIYNSYIGSLTLTIECLETESVSIRIVFW